MTSGLCFGSQGYSLSPCLRFVFFDRQRKILLIDKKGHIRRRGQRKLPLFKMVFRNEINQKKKVFVAFLVCAVFEVVEHLRDLKHLIKENAVSSNMLLATIDIPLTPVGAFLVVANHLLFDDDSFMMCPYFYLNFLLLGQSSKYIPGSHCRHP